MGSLLRVLPKAMFIIVYRCRFLNRFSMIFFTSVFFMSLKTLKYLPFIEDFLIIWSDNITRQAAIVTSAGVSDGILVAVANCIRNHDSVDGPNKNRAPLWSFLAKVEPLVCTLTCETSGIGEGNSLVTFFRAIKISTE